MTTIAITGVTGQVGSALADQLAADGHTILGLARSATSTTAQGRYLPRAVDLDDAAAFSSAVVGADALFLLATGEHPEQVVSAAASAGVRHIVLLSSQGAGTRPDAYRGASAFESAVRASGLSFTILRPSGFASNSFGWAQPIRDGGTVFAPFGDTALPVIDPRDIAAVAAAVLSSPDAHVGAVYELTGPEAVTPRQQTDAIAAAIGRPLDFVELTREDALARLSTVMPSEIADATLGILGGPSVRESSPTDAVERLTGRPATPFSSWAADHATAFGGGLPSVA
ncbi:NAD(P)H-binding protein [Humibacter sp. RRB41]|uniref:NAD(P)H-binding protein n=1 Tax=Humibacter sp. RRB41 TaxID=2919946 RepID=UPI001FAA521D|nr:NAD(P)H-binding protein [Humibacter sp. RRB41]